MDVEAHTGVAAIRFIECKGYAPYQELPEQEWKHWLEKIPVIERSARALYGPKTKLQFELWTTGKLSTGQALWGDKMIRMAAVLRYQPFNQRQCERQHWADSVEKLTKELAITFVAIFFGRFQVLKSSERAAFWPISGYFRNARRTNPVLRYRS